jgi:hypothetical protein
MATAATIFGPKFRQRDHDHPGHQQAAGQVRRQGDQPQAPELKPGTAPGDPGRDGDQEVLGEQFTAGQQERDETDGERQRAQQRLPGLVVDHQIGQDADPDIYAPEETGGGQGQQRPLEPVAALGDEPVEGLLDRGLASFTGRCGHG